MDKTLHSDCCGKLFGEFRFDNLRTSEPPNREGVFAIRVKQRGKSKLEIATQVRQLVDRLDWEQVGDCVISRVGRLPSIGQCPIIYVGSADSRADGKNTLLERYREFSNHHAAVYPIWALSYFDWELEFGWLEEKDASKAEVEIRKEYENKHDGKLPALVQR